MAQRRTEQPTARKLARARSLGMVPRSPELSAAAALLAAAGIVLWDGPAALAALRALARAGLTAGAQPQLPEDLFTVLAAPLRQVGLHAAAWLAVIAFAAWLAGFVQVGPLLSGPAVTPDLARLSPAERLRALASGENLEELAVSAVKLAVVLVAAACVLAPSVRGVLALPLGTVPRAPGLVAGLLLDFALRMGAVLALLGVCDLILRRVRHVRQQRMTRRELEDEWRESYGVPEQRQRRRRLQAELSAQAAVAGLARADVLLLDARGRAVALAFDAADAAQHAPRVVAKAAGRAGLRMHAFAVQHDVPVRWEGAWVAALFRLELTEPVPPEHYETAAEVFAELSGSGS
jgi:flagellar biosynthesis protein FlhB